MSQTPLSFHISDEQKSRLVAQGQGHGRRSEIIRLAIIHHGNPTAAEYLGLSLEGPYTNKINVARGDWYEKHEQIARDLGVSEAALARYALEKMLDSIEETHLLERNPEKLLT